MWGVRREGKGSWDVRLWERREEERGEQDEKEGKREESGGRAGQGIELFKAKKERKWGPLYYAPGLHLNLNLKASITFLALLELLAVLADLIQSIEQLRHTHPCAPHHALALIVLSVSFTVTVSLTATTILEKLGRWREKVRERKWEGQKRVEKECQQEEEAKRIEWKGEEWARQHEREKREWKGRRRKERIDVRMEENIQRKYRGRVDADRYVTSEWWSYKPHEYGSSAELSEWSGVTQSDTVVLRSAMIGLTSGENEGVQGSNRWNSGVR
jgi:hypothetical protein